jgi:hypothetical protein
MKPFFEWLESLTDTLCRSLRKERAYWAPARYAQPDFAIPEASGKCPLLDGIDDEDSRPPIVFPQLRFRWQLGQDKYKERIIETTIQDNDFSLEEDIMIEEDRVWAVAMGA